ncbi:MAG: hypothetical protein DWQ10_18825 [Calditrichaeota bacterium]|nr:MAG: hypothetical protein DWQ10_18825 [Calditrichota bacterium]
MGGKRLYQYARAGKTIQRAPRNVTIFAFDLLELTKDDCVARIKCSKGTYIRALARDIGQDLGCGAIISELRRTRIGDYSVDNAYTIDEFIASLKDTKPSNECLSRS